MSPASALSQLIQQVRAGEAVVGSELAQRGGFAAPEIPHGVPEFAVPFGPLLRESAHLAASRAQIPRFRNEPGPGDDGILLHHFKETGELVDGVEPTRQRGDQIKAEAVNVHLRDPVAQRIHDELERVRLAVVL